MYKMSLKLLKSKVSKKISVQMEKSNRPENSKSKRNFETLDLVSDKKVFISYIR